jgi:hypothetical protein
MIKDVVRYFKNGYLSPPSSRGSRDDPDGGDKCRRLLAVPPSLASILAAAAAGRVRSNSREDCAAAVA